MAAGVPAYCGAREIPAPGTLAHLRFGEAEVVEALPFRPG